MQEAKKKFRDFLENFVSDIPEEGGEPSIADHTEPYYMQRLEEVDYITASDPVYSNIREHGSVLYLGMVEENHHTDMMYWQDNGQRVLWH